MNEDSSVNPSAYASAHPSVPLGDENPGRLRLRLPATSANLGPGFDSAAVAFDFYLEIEAVPAAEFSIYATGRDREHIARLENNLILEIYKDLLESNGRPVIPLAIQMANGIPLGMGCGSSAAGRLAAIALAVHFGRLGWSSEQIIEEATALEGHPDNARAGKCMWPAFRLRQRGGRSWFFPPSHCPPARRAPCCRTATAARTWWPTSSRRRCWGWLLPRQGAIC
jgi:hypothetical protein